MNAACEGSKLVVSDLAELDAQSAPAFREMIRNSYQGSGDIVVNLQGARFIDSSGVGALIAVQKLAARKGYVVRLLNASPQLRDMFAQMRLDRIFIIESGSVSIPAIHPPDQGAGHTMR